MKKKLTVNDLAGLRISPRDAAFAIEYCKDFNARRAAVVVGISPNSAYDMRDKPEIQKAVEMILQHRLDDAQIDAEWLLHECVDNHRIARMEGKYTASNTALSLIGKHSLVQAFAPEKIHITTDDEVRERLMRGRQRNQVKEINPVDDNNTSDDEITFI